MMHTMSVRSAVHASCLLMFIVALRSMVADAAGFKLSNQEFVFVDTKAGQKVKFQINPNIDQAIKVERITEYEYNHMPRAAHPEAFQHKMAEVFGGHAKSTPGRAQRNHVSPHSEAWSLIETGEPRKAAILMDAHKSGNHELLKKVRDSLVHVSNPKHAENHKELQRTLLLERMEHAIKSGSKEHAFSKITTTGNDKSTFQCEYMCVDCGAKMDLSRNGPCRVYGCNSDQCKGIAKKLCRDEPDSLAGKACNIKEEPNCVAPCNGEPDPSMKDMNPMDRQAPNFWAEAMAGVGPIKPQVRLYGCVQADVSLLELTGAPVTIQVGIYGQISYNFGDKCYGWQVDTSLGVFFGVKLGGVSFGISINLVGSLSLEEVPYDGSSDAADLEKLNGEMKGDDFQDHRPPQVEGECPGRRPFALWTAFMDKMYRGLSRDQAITKRILEAKKKVKNSDGYKAYKNFEVAEPSDNGSPGDPDKGRYPLADTQMNAPEDTLSFATIKSAGKREVKVHGETGVAGSFRAMHHVAKALEHKNALYSAHVMKSLTDYEGDPSSKTRKHYEYSNGRYLARVAPGAGMSEAASVPCSKITEKDFCTTGDAKNFCEWKKGTIKGKCTLKDGQSEMMERGRMIPKKLDEKNEETEGKEPETPANGEGDSDGASENAKPRSFTGLTPNFDDRTMNIPRAMRKSFHNENPYFWRNAAISTVNLWVRYIGDLQAIFNVYFAGTPNWEGDCTSLPGRHHLMFEGVTIKDNVQTKENNMAKEGKTMEDDEWPWYQRHWISTKKVKEGETGKITAEWFEKCDMCPKEDVPSIIYPTPLCLSIEAKLADDYQKIIDVRKDAIDPIPSRELPGSRPAAMKDYKPNFLKAATGRAPEGVKADWAGGFLLAFDRTCNILWGDVKEKYRECEKAAINDVFAATYPRMMERIISLYAKMDRNLELIDMALCEGNTTECKPTKQMTKVLATQVLNDVRMFVLSFLNTDEWSHIIDKDTFLFSREKGLLPSVTQVRKYGPNVFQRTVSGGAVRDMMKDLGKYGYRYALEVTEPELKKKKMYDLTKTKRTGGDDDDDDDQHDGDDDQHDEEVAEGKPNENEKAPLQALLQTNSRSEKGLRMGKTSKHRRSLHKVQFVKGKVCQKDEQCAQSKCRGNHGCAWGKCMVNGNCAPVPGSLKGNAECEEDIDCESGVCEGNLKGLQIGFCRRMNVRPGEVCKRDIECESGMCTGGRFVGEGICTKKAGTNQPLEQCHYDKECTGGICRGNKNGLTHGFCLYPKQEGGKDCDSHKECLSAIGCSSVNNAETEPSKETKGALKANNYQGKCYFMERSRMSKETCSVHKECLSTNCKNSECSDDPRPSILDHAKEMFNEGKQYVGSKIMAAKNYVSKALFSKNMKGIEKGVVEEMNEDFASMFGVKCTDRGTPQEVVNLVGDVYHDIAKFGNEIRKDPENFQQAFYDRNIGYEKSKIINNLPPVVDYTVTFTLDIESQAPGFCGPSSASLQVIMSKSWTGSTGETATFNKRQMCMSLRLASGKIAFLIDMCYDIPDCKGLKDIDDETEKAKDGEVIVSDMEIGFNVFQFLDQMSSIDEASKAVIPALIEEDPKKEAKDPKEVKAENKAEKMNGKVEDVKAQIEPDPIEVRDTAEEMAKGSSMKDIGAKIKRALQDGSLLSSQMVAAVMSKKIAWSFAQAFIADDDLTNQGDEDFMKYGVSLASAASFFYEAVAASQSFGTNLLAESKILHPDPSGGEKISPVAFKLNHDLVLEGRGSFKIQKRACTPQEKIVKEDKCAHGDIKFWGVTECSDVACEVGKPVEMPDVSLTFQSWNRAELVITVPPVVLFPTLGLELEFDITKLLYLGVNARRAGKHRKRVDKCLQCVKAEKGFCDRKWKAVDYDFSDDRCRDVGKKKRMECEVQGHAGGIDNGETPRWIITADGCLDMSWPAQQHTAPVFFGNQLHAPVHMHK